MRVIVDDQLALLANRGALLLPELVERPLVLTYGFQLRLASALGAGRETSGTLQRWFARYAADTDPGDLVRDSAHLRVIDPTTMTIDIARAKLAYRCNLLAAEVVATARRLDAEVRLTPGNAEGRLVGVLAAASVPYAIWRPAPGAGGVAVADN